VKKLLLVYVVLGVASVYSQEGLLSDVEQYYDFLALQGLAERSYLNYRTLSDSVWNIPSRHLWNEQNLGTRQKVFAEFFMRVYGPEMFASYNTAAPYGQNDGALWQGKGFNTSLTGGVRFEGYGVELTYKPQLVFSQNKSFDLMSSGYSSGYGYIWSYDTNVGMDAPQRFGDEALFAYSWGDSEIRYTWKTVTIGFGTQSIWLGAGRINSIMHSNNAPPYPKFDFGIRRQPVTIPWVDWYAGDLEARVWAGYLSESAYFDDNDTNNHNLITGLALAYAPSFLPDLTLYMNKTFLTKWGIKNFSYVADLFWDTGVQEEEDQRVSMGIDYLLPQAGIEVYGEIGVDDYSDTERYPLHTMVYLVGLRKDVPTLFQNTRGELIFEWSTFEMSQDYQFGWPTTFYGHHKITQGYTNRGQWLGAGIGTGGNSQYLGFKVYYPQGYVSFYFYRVNPDNDFIYKNSIQTTLPTMPDGSVSDAYRFKAILSFGAQISYFITKSTNISLGFVRHKIINPNYNTYIDAGGTVRNTIVHNYSILMKVQVYF
jgi:hypothetical protein